MTKKCKNMILMKFERKIPALIEEFCNYYAHHQNKTVVYYYDTTALGANYAVNEQAFIGWYATNLRNEAGKWKMSILATQCDTMKSTF